MKIILIGNYPPDKQYSMYGFCVATKEGMINQGHTVDVWTPISVFGRFFSSTSIGAGKWFGYVDKWIIFPVVILLRRFLQSKTDKQANYHICDHSNSMYMNFLPKKRTLITCHDVLAIQGSMGIKNAHSDSTRAGKILQNLIRKNLVTARYVVAISNYTYRQLLSLALPSTDSRHWNIIHNMYKSECKILDQTTIQSTLHHLRDIISAPFIMHVGSDLPRKNRKVLVDVMAKLRDQWNGNLVFVGAGPSEEMKNKIQQAGLTSRILFIENPSTEVVVALYNVCFAVVFPSYTEGFGLPLIEAQACGAPVIASNIEPLMEVSNESALHAAPDDAEGFSRAVLSLVDPATRIAVIRKGTANVQQYQPETITSSYMKVHQLMRTSLYPC
ncbi:glycosyltransferase family 4 protein [Flavitalea antarctica]